MKRGIDCTLALVLLLFFLPLLLLLSCVIYFSLGPPVLFRQVRSGLNGKPFVIYKFRTMTEKISPDGKVVTDAERLTVLGRCIRNLSLDELPQLINILKGDMSFVGPRPLLMDYNLLYNKEQVKRLLVKPGLTGWAQVNGRNSISWEEKFKLDVWYVENRSLMTDGKIVWMTILRLLRPKGVNQQPGMTMEKFKGTTKEQTKNDS